MEAEPGTSDVLMVEVNNVEHEPFTVTEEVKVRDGVPKSSWTGLQGPDEWGFLN